MRKAPSRCHLAASGRLQSSDSGQPFTAAIEERVDPEAFPERGRPSQTPRHASACLPQQGEDGVMRAGFGARGQESKVADGMSVRERPVLRRWRDPLSYGIGSDLLKYLATSRLISTLSLSSKE